MEICPVGNSMIHPDKWTDITKLIDVFHDYTNVPKMYGRRYTSIEYVMTLQTATELK